MADPLAAAALMAHIHVLADEIGARPPGHPAEEQAREYIRRSLGAIGFVELEEQLFRTVDTPGYGLGLPHALALLGNLVGMSGRWGRVIGGISALYAGYSLWRYGSGLRQLLQALAPKYPSANLIARIPASGERRQRVVLVGHTDTQKYRQIFEPATKRLLPGLSTLAVATLLLNGLSQLALAVGIRRASTVTRICMGFQAYALLQILADERGQYVAGANDNATAVACLLGLAAQLHADPLRHTEVWLAFTGAEEVMCEGMHQLLDAHGDQLRDAWFIDFEMVGARETAYLTRHTGLSYLNAYRPDAESLALAERTAAQHPELAVGGRELMIIEEVGTLRSRGYRGICLAGVGPDGWLENWHLHSDISQNIHPDGVERAARFALAMLQELDQKT